MKFSFPFFGKKSKPLDREIEGAEDIVFEAEPAFEEEKPVINWDAVQAAPMPGLEVIPEDLPPKDMNFSVPDASTATKNSTTDGLDGKKETRIFSGAPVAPSAQEIASQSKEEPIIEPLAPEKLPTSQEQTLEPLEIEDLLKTKPFTIPETIVDDDLESAPNSVNGDEPVKSTQTPVAPALASTAIPAKPLLMTREDVIAAYKIFLNRLPESFEVIQSRVNSSAEANLIDFALADEFIKRPDLPAIIYPVAKKILEAQEQSQASTNKPTQP